MPQCITRVFFVLMCMTIVLQCIKYINVYAFEPSTAETDFHNEPKAFDFHNMLSYYQPTYFLVFYHTQKPYHGMYAGHTPSSTKLRNNEIKVQISADILLFRSLFDNDNLRLYLAYTQLFFWQLYSPVQFIRETNYEPMLLLRYHFAENMFANLTLDHQSNGKGGYMEVSWNRIVGAFEFTTKHWYTKLTLWLPFMPLKADDRNPNTLPYYLGYDNLLISYNIKDVVLSVEAQNFESALTRGHIMATLSYSATSRFKLYLQYFYGYGQSLIEYDHFTNAFGVGLAVSDWQ